MALVKYKGPEPSVYVPEAGKSCAKGASIEVTEALAIRLMLQTQDWEGGNAETLALGSPNNSPLAVPPVAEQKKVSIGAPHPPLTVNANFTLDGAQTKFKIPHGLGTNNVTATVQTHEGGVAKEVTTVAKIVAINSNEIEITLGSAGVAGTTYWVQIHN